MLITVVQLKYSNNIGAVQVGSVKLQSALSSLLLLQYMCCNYLQPFNYVILSVMSCLLWLPTSQNYLYDEVLQTGCVCNQWLGSVQVVVRSCYSLQVVRQLVVWGHSIFIGVQCVQSQWFKPVHQCYLHIFIVVRQCTQNLGISYRQSYSALPYSKLANGTIIHKLDNLGLVIEED